MRANLSTADFGIIAIYFIFVLLIGFQSKRKNTDSAEYFLAGRSLTLPVFVMTLVSTWYGGILGVGEYSYRYGLANWVTQGLPYYICAFLFAIFLAKRARSANVTTVSDQFRNTYGPNTALLGSFFLFLFSTPAPYVLMIGVLIQLLTGWSMWVCVVLGSMATMGYLISGGFRSDVNTDIFEFFCMFLGFAVILPFSFFQFGGIDFFKTHVPAEHFTLSGGNSVQFILMWFFMAIWTFVDPTFYQRCFAAKSEKVAQKGIFVSILFWFIFDAMTTTAGFYARAALPDLAEPMMSYPLLAELTLPPLIKGFFYVGMLATIMSTLNSSTFVSATILGRDVLWRTLGTRSAVQEKTFARVCIFITGFLSIGLCLFIPSVVELWYTIGTVMIPGLFVPLVTSYFKPLRVRARFAFLSMLGGWVTALIWLSIGWAHKFGSSDAYPFGIEPIFAGLAVSFVIWIAGKFE